MVIFLYALFGSVLLLCFNNTSDLSTNILLTKHEHELHELHARSMRGYYDLVWSAEKIFQGVS